MGKAKAAPHTVYNINYHIVWIPKYRRHILIHGVKERLTDILHEIAERYDFDIETMDVQPDHIHVFCSAPPRYAPSQVAAIMKSISAKKLFEEFPQIKKELWGSHLWARDYYVGTAGDKITSDMIKRYIKYCQDQRQLSLFDRANE